MLGYVYMITNNINGKVYIGQHSKSDRSLEQLDTTYWASGIKINNAFKKYGYENFKREILHWCDTYEDLNRYEKYYIELFDALNDDIGYNIAAGGVAGNMTAGYSDDEKEAWKQKISIATREAMQRPEVYDKLMQAIKKRSANEEWRKKISESVKQQPHRPMSDEAKQKLSERMKGTKYGVGNKSNLGRHLSEETKAKISEAGKKVVHTPEWNAKVAASLRGCKRSDETKDKLRGPKPKYRWLLPDGSIQIMDASNGVRHQGWTRLDKIS